MFGKRNSAKRIFAGVIAAALFSIGNGALITPPNADALPATTTAGTDFWLTFPSNYTTVGTLTLFVSGTSSTTGTITDAGGSPTPFSVTAGAVTSLSVNGYVDESVTDGIVNQGIHVTSVLPVTIYGLNAYTATSDAYTALPTNALGTRYRVASYPGFAAGYASRLTVVASVDATTVSITPSVTIGSHTAGVAYTETLNQGQVYSVEATNGTDDLSGSLITSDKPVAVWGSSLSNITLGGNGGAADLLMQELPPTNAWGEDFLTVRFAKADHGDPYRVVADTNGTVVTVDGSVVATLNAGQYYTGVASGPSGANLNVGDHITTSNPALVVQYLTGGSYTNGSTTVSGDPGMMIVPPSQQYLNSYTFTTPPSQFTVNFANVAVPTSAVGSVTMDNSTVAAGMFNPIAGTSYSSAQIPLTLGAHSISASAGFGLFVYGLNSADSYAYMGGSSIASLSFTPPSAPTGLTVTPGVNQLTLTWNDNAAGDAVSRYDYSLDGGATWIAATATDSAGVETQVITSLTAGTTYSVQVRAVNAGGNAATATVLGTPTGTGVVPTPPPATPTTQPVPPVPGVAAPIFVSPTGTVSSVPVYNTGDPNQKTAATPTGAGSWTVKSDGGVFTAGDAPFYGSAASLKLNSPAVGVAPTSDGKGYFVVSADGGVFAYGDATFKGSMGGKSLNAPITELAPSCTSNGYYLVAKDGGVFTYGDANFYGSMGGKPLNQPMQGLVDACGQGGYWTWASDGGVFSFGNAKFYGSLGSNAPKGGIIAMVSAPDGLGYWLIGADKHAYGFGSVAN